MHKFFYVYLFLVITLYMFRAHRAHHQERQIVSIQPGNSHSMLVAEMCAGWKKTHLLMMSTMCSKRVESYK